MSILLAIMSAITSSGYYLSLDKLTNEYDSDKVLIRIMFFRLLYISGIGCSYIYFKFSWLGIFLLLATGVVESIGIGSGVKAMKYLDISIYYPLSYFYLVIISILDYLIFGTYISIHVIIGIGLFVISVFLLSFKESLDFDNFLRGILFSFISMTCWAISPIICQYLLKSNSINTSTLIIVTNLIITLRLSCTYFYRRYFHSTSRGLLVKVNPPIKKVMYTSIFGVATDYLYTQAAFLGNITLVSLIDSSSIFIVFMVSVTYFKTEKFTRYKCLGTVLAIVSTVLFLI